jgi:ABC-type glutathione transport system ATPase component
MNSAAASQEPLLQVRDLTVELLADGQGPARLLSGISFDVAAGEIAGLFGESGCGKTTLAHALVQLLPRDRFRVRGSIRFRGIELVGLRERDLQPIRGGGIALIPQDPLLALNPVLRAGHQVDEAVRAHRRVGRRELRDEVRSLFELAGLDATERLYSSYPHQLSGGERQRVLIAQALAGRPALVIADEPFTALDPERVVDICSLLRKLRDTLGTSLLAIGHDPGVLAHLADSVLVMHAGRIVERGPSPQLFRAPSDPYTAGLLRYAL